ACSSSEGKPLPPDEKAPVEAPKPAPPSTPLPGPQAAGGSSKPAPPTPSGDSARCNGMGADAAKLFDAGKSDDAKTAFAKAYETCGAGYGFLQAQGYILSQEGKLEEAADLYLREISEDGPKPEAFGNLERIRDKLSEKTKARIVALGPDAKHPVHVIGI